MPDFHIGPGRLCLARLDDQGNVIEMRPFDIAAPPAPGPASGDDQRVFSLRPVTTTWTMRWPLRWVGRIKEWLWQRVARWN